MDMVSLKITILTIFVLIDTITWTLGVPLRRQSKSSLVDWTNYNAYEPEGRGTYAFGYDVEDPETNNIQFRDEERHPNGTITGSYGYLRPDGMVHIAHYVADDKGYRVSIENNQRGQLKPYGNSDKTFIPQALSSSPAMISALRSKEVYKKQNIHEKRRRPVDVIPKQNLRFDTPSSFRNSYEEQLNRASNSDLQESFNFENSFFNDDDIHYADPYGFFMNDK